MHFCMQGCLRHVYNTVDLMTENGRSGQDRRAVTYAAAASVERLLSKGAAGRTLL